MTRLHSTVILFIIPFLLTAANKNDESIADTVISASSFVELRRMPKLSSDISTSDSVAREQRVLPEYGHDALDDLDSISKRPLLRSDFGASNNGIFSETKKPAPKKSGQISSKSGGYGYPYRIAPTLPPYDKHVSDRSDDEPASIIPTGSNPSEPKMPSMPRIPSMPKVSRGSQDELSKRSDPLKKRQGFTFDDDSSESGEFTPISVDYSSYKEPSYRNTHELEFSPRRMYYESRGPQSRPHYSFPTLKPRSNVSPRDPYLSPSSEPIDGFYPKVKNNGVSTSYSSYGKRDKYYKSVPDSVSPHSRGYDDDDDFSGPSSEEDDYRLGNGGYMASHKYEDGPSPFSDPDPYSEPPSEEPVRAGEESSYDSLYNSPVIGLTRKRLLEYAGASDLYEGEPDYVKSSTLRKTKFGSIQDDYFPYPRSRSYSFTDYHFDESRIIPSRVKRQVLENGQTVPRCSRNTTLPMCLTDADYPTEEVEKMVSKNMKFLSQLRNIRLEINEKKSISNDPESLEDLKKTNSVCSSKKGSLYPKRAKDVDGTWRIVINVGNVKQSIEVDMCRSTETPCNYVPAAIPTICVQKFSFVTLVTFNSKENILEHHDFPVPSACSCSLERQARFLLE